MNVPPPTLASCRKQPGSNLPTPTVCSVQRAPRRRRIRARSGGKQSGRASEGSPSLRSTPTSTPRDVSTRMACSAEAYMPQPPVKASARTRRRRASKASVAGARATLTS